MVKNLLLITVLLLAGTYRTSAQQSVQSQQQESASIVGKWFIRIDGVIKSYNCLYLELKDDGTVSLSQQMMWIKGLGDKNDSESPWYIVEGWFKLDGRYEKLNDQLRFSWNSPDNVRLQDFKCYYNCNESESKFQKEADPLLLQFKEYARRILVTPTIEEVTDCQLCLNAGGERLLFTNTEESAELKAQTEKQKVDEYFNVNKQERKITSFKKYFKDAVVTFNSSGNSTIEWKNGDIYQGSFDIGFIKHNGFIVNGVGYKWVDAYEGEDKNPYVRAWMMFPLLSYLELHFVDGTYLTVDGERQEWKQGNTNDQINGILNNFEKKLTAELTKLKNKCENTRKQLIAEGYNEKQVNSLILKGDILYGTPRSLFIRAAELGCNFKLSPEILVDRLYHAHWVEFTDINTGYTTVAAFVRFHWIWDTVNYVGSTLP